MILHAETALLPDGWARDVRLRIEDGRIAEVTTGVPGPGHGVILPAPVNLHSHMFQRAMAGMTEGRTAGQDSFWTWRTLMYRFLDRLTPEDVQAIAAQAMVEMAESGFAAVCEFHYLHHPVGGGIYADPAEMSGRIAAAAAETGLGLTHLPVIYEQGGVDGRALAGGQLRFGSSSDTYAAVLDGAGRALDLPVKLHAEQLTDQQGAAFAARHGALSVDHLEYLSPDGVAALAAAGTVAVILPGAFYTLRETQAPPIGALRAAGVPMAVATDLNPGSSPLASLTLAMNMACTLFRMTPEEALLGTTAHAARALGLTDRGRIAPGLRADLCLWDADHPAELSYRIGATALHTRIFGGRPDV